MHLSLLRLKGLSNYLLLSIITAVWNNIGFIYNWLSRIHLWIQYSATFSLGILSETFIIESVLLQLQPTYVWAIYFLFFTNRLEHQEPPQCQGCIMLLIISKILYFPICLIEYCMFLTGSPEGMPFQAPFSLIHFATVLFMRQLLYIVLLLMPMIDTPLTFNFYHPFRSPTF